MSSKKTKEGLTQRQCQLIKETWSKIVPLKEQTAKMFYDRLFEIDASIKPLFHDVNMKNTRNNVN